LARWRRTDGTQRPAGAARSEPKASEVGGTGRFPAALVCVLALVTHGAGADQARSLRFARHGEPVATLDLDALRDAAQVRTVRVHEPYEGREVAFRAVAFDDVLDAVYGEAWRRTEDAEAGDRADELLFTCRDGYQPTVPVARFLEHAAWLAFERVGSEDFAIDKHESGRLQRVDLGPFYLVWENVGDARLLREGDYGWPYQVVAVDRIRARERFPRMAPPAEAPPRVREGFRAFRIHCSRCHTVNGEGGSIGPELNAAPAPAGTRDPAWLRRWIDDPSRFVPAARMPPLNPGLPDRAETIDALVAYLRAMAERPLPAASAEGGDA